MSDYEVGYGKPPKSGRWAPGQSGNPTGRRKSGAAFLTEAAEILSEPVKAKTASGGSVSLGALEAAYLSMCRKALKGDGAALYQAIGIMLELLPAGESAKEEREAEGRGAKRRLAEMIGLSPEVIAQFD
jgi:hypothetical protein